MKKNLLVCFTVSLYLIFFVNRGYATDLTVTDIIPPFLELAEDFASHPIITIPQQGDGAPVSAVIENLNGSVAESYAVHFHAYDPSTHELLWWDTQLGTDLEPGGQVTINSVNWNPLPGYYDFVLVVQSPGDTDTKNDMLVEFGYEAILHPNTVAEKLIQKIQVDFPKMQYDDGSIKSPGFLNPEPIMPGQVVKTAVGDELDVTIENTSYMVFAPYSYSDKYSQPAEFFLIDAKDTTITNDSINWYVEIDTFSFIPDTWSKIDMGNLIFGPEPEILQIPDMNSIFGEVTAAKRDSACVLIVSGEICKDWEMSSFTKDLDLVKNNLMREQYGMQLEASQIVRIDNATKTEVLLAIQKMQGKCEKIVFYYTGHGGEGMMWTRDDYLPYYDLAYELFNTNARDVTVIIDACYSGSAEKDLRAQFDNRPRKLTILTSSSASKTSYTNTVLTTPDEERYNPGFFTWNLMKQYGDPKADTDGDKKTSFPEALYRLRKVNPEILGESITDVQNPQLIFNKLIYPEPGQTHFSEPDMGMEMNYFQPPDDNAMIELTEISGVKNTEFVGENILFISDTRYYSIEMMDQYSPFTLDITFTYNPEIDNVAGLEADMGMVKRDSEEASWEKIPSLYFPDVNQVKATDITGFSDFAFAHVIPEAVSDIHSAPENNTDLRVYLNPVENLLSVYLYCSESREARLDIVDISGRILLSDITILDAGNNKYVVDMNRIPRLKPGIYAFVMYSHNQVSSGLFAVSE